MKRNKKLTLIALVAMLFMAVAVTFLSFSKADEDLSGEELDLVAAGNSLDVGSKTNVDYIIQNANSTETDVDKNYHIIEIYSGSPSALGTYISSGKFAGLVINENRTTKGDADDKEINPKNIDFKAYKASSISNTDTELLVEISNADLIYINQDSTVFQSPNDLAEKLYDILHTYAVGDYKPIIFNSQATSGSNSGNNTEKPTSVSDLVSKVFSSGSYYYTFAWKEGVDVDDFLAHKNGSLYLAINGTKQSNKGKWGTLVDKADPTKTKTMSKFLVVTNGTESSKMNELLISTDSDVTNTLPNDYKVGDAEFDLGTSKLYDRTKIKNNIYNLKYAVPDYIQLDQKKLTELDNVDLAQYDFIYIDTSAGGASTISETIYTKFAGAMYGNVSIVYDGTLGSSTASTTTTTTTTTNTQATNYLELYYMVATQDNLSRYNNVMITEPNQFSVIMSGDTAAAGAIAELINASTYRGIGGKSSSSNMFTVLEIQPCYPIDVDLAKSTRGGKTANSYYTIPANVLNDVDKSTLPTDADGNITVEYYDWELTKAKIADAVGIDPNQVNVVHMSTEELAASKEPLLGTYDLIYIGGNQSALKTDLTKWQSIANVGGNGNNVSNLGYNDNGIAKLPIYTMYSHNGDIAIISDGPFSSGTRGSGTPVPKVKVNGSYKDTFALLNGNDISYDRLLELEEYVKAKMPVIIEDDVTLAYEIIAGTENVPGKGYLQNAIDPDCNMYKFLKFCNDGDYITKTGETDGRKHTVLWKVDNTSDDMTFTTGGDAKSDGTIREDENKKVNSLIIGSNTRPKLTVTSLPTIYNFYDKTTRLDSKDLKFAFEVAGSAKYDVKLYVDDDGNSIFAPGEVMDADVTKTGNSGTLKYTLNDNFDGPVYWKLEVEDTTTKMTSYITGLSYVKNSDGAKQTVRILQIMPGYSVTSDGKTQAYVKGQYTTTSPEGAQGQDTLYFCPVCQRGFELYEFYPIANTNSHLGMWYYGTGAYLQSNTNPNEARDSQNPYLGKHEHIFGLPWYDSGLTVEGYTGVDDWSTNIADDVSDMFDFDLDIMVRGDFEQTARDIAAAYDFSTWTQAQKTTKINSFAISADDPDYNEWSALATDDQKLRFIVQRDYEKLANDEYELYMDAKTETDATIPALETALDTAINSLTGTGDDFSNDLKVVKATKRYADMFSAVNNAGDSGFRYRYMHNTTLKALANAYFDYRDKKDIEITHHQLYKEYMRYTNPDNWLAGSYDMIIIGAADNFAQDDISDPIALADLEEYVKPEDEGGYAGNMLLFHGVLSPYSDKGSAALTSRLRGYFGMDKNRGLTNDNPKDGEYYVNYASSDSDRYFMTNLSWKPTTDSSRYATWKADVFTQTTDDYLPDKGAWLSPSKYLTNVAYTDAVNLSFANPGISQYAYAVSDYTSISQWAMSSNASDFRDLKAEKSKSFGTDKASQNNKGIVTQYPFTLSDELNISPTHPQEYALELDNDNMTVWYSLAGGTNVAKNHGNNGYYSNSSLYAASRNDGGDNYFIYSFGNVNYCGAGHSKVTGVGLDNNDERRLYINIIVNSVKKSVNGPSIKVYDFKTEKEKPKDGADYIMETGDTDSYPEFTFRVTVDTGATLKRVRIYYDLDYLITNSDVFVEDGDTNHILITDMTTNLKAGDYIDVASNIARLQLKSRYFEPYNNEYTYIVIEATDSNGKKVYRRIKIKLLPHLFDLT